MTQKMISAEEKRRVYATLKTKLKIALHQEFFFEALLLEYSILEDRLFSILGHAGIRNTNSKGEPLGFQAKLNKIDNAIRSKQKPIYGKVKPEIVQAVFDWKETRNTLVHRSCQRIYNGIEVEQCAKAGNELVNLVTNAAQSIKNATKKKAIKG